MLYRVRAVSQYFISHSYGNISIESYFNVKGFRHYVL